MEPIRFGGLQANVADELVALDYALTATDLFLDDGTIASRHGYSRAHPNVLAGSGTAQHIGAFITGSAGTPDNERVLAVAAGTLYALSAPLDNTTGTPSTVGTLTGFGVSAPVCGVQYGENYYLGCETANAAWQRVDSSLNVTSLLALPKADATTAITGTCTSAHTWVETALAARAAGRLTFSANTTYTEDGTTGWVSLRHTSGAGTPPPIGSYLLHTFDGAARDWSNAAWLAVGISPDNHGENAKVTVSVSSNGSTFYDIGSTYDPPPTGGSPNLLYCDLTTLNATVRASVAYVKLTHVGTEASFMAYYGVMPLSAKQAENPVKYVVDMYDPTTQQASDITDPAIEVTVTAPTFAVMTDRYYDNNGLKGTGGNIDIFANALRTFNREGAVAYPLSANWIGGVITISGTTPSGYAGNLTVRVWRTVANGRRLVGTAVCAASTAWSIKDPGDNKLYTASPYKAGGVPKQATCCAARHSRLIYGFRNRLNISSYTPVDETGGSVFPQFPAIALEDADGWSFDVSPSRQENILALVNGDALYIATNESVYSMDALTPNSPCSLVYRRGVMGRHAMTFVEGSVVWASWDGVYIAANRTQTTELTQSVRRIYKSWLAPDSATVLAYQNRKLWISNPTNKRYLRYDFVTQTWTQGTLAGSLVCAARWHPNGWSDDRLWFLSSDLRMQRFLATATSDDGTAIAPWVYGTGWTNDTTKSVVKRILGDVAGAAVNVSIYKTSSASPTRAMASPYLAVGLTERPVGSDLPSYQWRLTFTATTVASVVSACFWERQPNEGKGG